MNRDEEIALIRKKQIETIKSRSLRVKLTEGFLVGVLLIGSIGVIYWGYHALDTYMTSLGE